MTTTRLAIILLMLATASTPASARWYRHYGNYGYGGYYNSGSYNYGGPRYTASDYYHNSRQLVGTR